MIDPVENVVSFQDNDLVSDPSVAAQIAGYRPGHQILVRAEPWGVLLHQTGPQIESMRGVSRDPDGNTYVSLLGFRRRPGVPFAYLDSLASTIVGASRIGASYLGATANFDMALTGFDGELDPIDQDLFAEWRARNLISSRRWRDTGRSYYGKFTLAPTSFSMMLFGRMVHQANDKVCFAGLLPSARGVWAELDLESPWRSEDAKLDYLEDEIARTAWADIQKNSSVLPGNLRDQPRILSGATIGFPPGLPGFYPGSVSGYLPPATISLSEFALPVRRRPTGRIRPEIPPDHTHATPRSQMLAEHIQSRLDQGPLREPVVQSIQQGVKQLDDHEAVSVHRALVTGGHTPEDADEASDMLGRVLRKQDSYTDDPAAPSGLGSFLDSYEFGNTIVTGLTELGRGLAELRQAIGHFIHDTRDRLKSYLSLPPALVPAVTRTQQRAVNEAREALRVTMIQACDKLAEFNRLNEQIRQAFVLMIRAENPVKFRLDVDTSVARDAQRSAQDAMQFLATIVARGSGEDGELHTRVSRWPESYRRAGYEPAGQGIGVIRVAPWYDATGALHALGHLCEANLAGLRSAANQFLSYRCGRKPFVDIGTIPGGEDLAGIQVRDGGFSPILAAPANCYVTRVGNFTEVFSVGLELLWSDPAGLALLDPEYFKWMLGVLTGELRQAKFSFNPDQPRGPDGKWGSHEGTKNSESAAGKVAVKLQVPTTPPATEAKGMAGATVVPTETYPIYGEHEPDKQKLQQANVGAKRALNTGCNASMIVELDDGSKGVFKPEAGEDHGLREAIKGRYYAREAAASDVADLLNLSSLIPPTVVRTVEGQIGSCQKFIDKSLPAFKVEDTQRFDGETRMLQAAALDFLIGNSDRHCGNWMLKESTGDLVLIDHGLSFPDSHSPLYSSEFLTKASKGNKPIPAEVQDWVQKKGDLTAVLKAHGLSDDEINLTHERLDLMASCADFHELHTKVRRKWDFKE